MNFKRAAQKAARFFTVIASECEATQLMVP